MVSTSARLTLDLGVGIGIFFATLIFVSTFIPSIFVDVRSEISVANQAYRISSLLAEDSGIYTDPNQSTRAWETFDAAKLCNDSVKFRPGFAKFDYGVKWGEIDLKKVQRFFDVLNLCREKVRDTFGLNLTRFGGGMYRFHVSVTNLSDGSSISGGDQIPVIAKTVKFRRMAYANGSDYEIEVTVWR